MNTTEAIKEELPNAIQFYTMDILVTGYLECSTTL